MAAEDAKYEDGYLKPLKSGLSDYFELDIEGLKEKVRNFTEAVITFANSPEDDASRVPIYRAQAFAFVSDDKRAEEDVKLRNAARKLARENTRSEIIANYINKESLVALDKALRMEMLEAVKLRVAKECANTIIAASKSRLTELSSRKPLPPSKPITDYFRATFYEDGLSKLLGELESPVDLESEDAGRFTKKRRRTKVQSASEGKKRVSTQFGIAGLYKTPDMLSKLRFLRSFPDELKLSAHKLLVKLTPSSLIKRGIHRCLADNVLNMYLFMSWTKHAIKILCLLMSLNRLSTIDFLSQISPARFIDFLAKRPCS